MAAPTVSPYSFRNTGSGLSSMYGHSLFRGGPTGASATAASFVPDRPPLSNMGPSRSRTSYPPKSALSARNRTNKSGLTSQYGYKGLASSARKLQTGTIGSDPSLFMLSKIQQKDPPAMNQLTEPALDNATYEANAVLDMLKERLSQKVQSVASLRNSMDAVMAKTKTLSYEINTENSLRVGLAEESNAMREASTTTETNLDTKAKSETQLIDKIQHLMGELRANKFEFKDVTDRHERTERDLKATQTSLKQNRQNLLDLEFQKKDVVHLRAQSNKQKMDYKSRFAECKNEMRDVQYSSRQRIEELDAAHAELESTIDALRMNRKVDQEQKQTFLRNISRLEEDSDNQRLGIERRIDQVFRDAKTIENELGECRQRDKELLDVVEAGRDSENELQKSLKESNVRTGGLKRYIKDAKVTMAEYVHRTSDLIEANEVLQQCLVDGNERIEEFRTALHRQEDVLNKSTSGLQLQVHQRDTMDRKVRATEQSILQYSTQRSSAEARVKSLEAREEATEISMQDALAKQESFEGRHLNIEADVKERRESLAAAKIAFQRAMVTNNALSVDADVRTLALGKRRVDGERAVEALAAQSEEKKEMLLSMEEALELAREQRRSLAEKVKMVEETVADDRKQLDGRLTDCQDDLTKMSGQVWGEDQAMANWRQDVGTKQSELRILQTKIESREKEREGLDAVLPGAVMKLEVDVTAITKRLDQRKQSFRQAIAQSEQQNKATTKCYSVKCKIQAELDDILENTVSLAQKVSTRSAAHGRQVSQSEEHRQRIKKVDFKLDKESVIADELFVQLNDAEGKGEFMSRFLHDSQKALDGCSKDMAQALDDKSVLLGMESGQKTKFSQIMSSMHDQFMSLRNQLLDKTEENAELEGEIMAHRRAGVNLQTKLQMIDMLNSDEINDFENMQRDVRRQLTEASDASNEEDIQLMGLKRQIRKSQQGTHELEMSLRAVQEKDKRMQNNINMHNSETRQIQEKVETKDRLFPMLRDKLSALADQEQELDKEISESDLKLEHAMKQVKQAEYQKRVVGRLLTEKQDREDRILANIGAVKGKIKNVGVQDNIKELLARARLRSYDRE